MHLLPHWPAPGRVACLSQIVLLEDSAETSLHTACRSPAGVLDGHRVMCRKMSSDLKQKTEKLQLTVLKDYQLEGE